MRDTVRGDSLNQMAGTDTFRSAPAGRYLSAVELLEDIIYSQVDGVELALDLYLPKNRGPATPLVLYLHGGGWMMGSKSHFPERLLGMAERGIAVASANYRLTHLAPFPAQLHDVKSAIRWLSANAFRYDLPTRSLAIWGASAGAMLAAFAAFTQNDPAWDSDVSQTHPFPLAGAMLWFGTYDFTLPPPREQDMVRRTVPEELKRYPPPEWLPQPLSADHKMRKLLGEPAKQEEPRLLRMASAINTVTDRAPPTLLMHGSADSVVSINQSEALLDRLRKAGVQSQLVRVPGANHESDRFHEHDLLDLAAGFFTMTSATARIEA